MRKPSLKRTLSEQKLKKEVDKLKNYNIALLQAIEGMSKGAEAIGRFGKSLCNI